MIDANTLVRYRLPVTCCTVRWSEAGHFHKPRSFKPNLSSLSVLRKKKFIPFIYYFFFLLSPHRLLSYFLPCPSSSCNLGLKTCRNLSGSFAAVARPRYVFNKTSAKLSKNVFLQIFRTSNTCCFDTYKYMFSTIEALGGRTAQLAIIRLIDGCQRYSLVEELHK